MMSLAYRAERQEDSGATYQAGRCKAARVYHIDVEWNLQQTEGWLQSHEVIQFGL